MLPGKSKSDVMRHGRSATAVHLSAMAKLCSLLARVFSYPDRIEAQAYTSVEFLDICEGFVSEAGFPARIADDVCERFAEMSNRMDSEERGKALRVEYTQLFTLPPRPISLVGSKWVHNRTLASERKGERFAVDEVYRELGLRNKPTVRDPADHLVSELDFMHYILRAEARAWDNDDLVMARDWRQLRDDFLEYHLYELALGVAHAIDRMSSNAHMRYYAALLRLVIEHI
ncbi:Uncharacterized component of anaerobic dehydrogenases [Slackia heliotrinireducens]|uniref:TorD/DmsD family molecular chaperone n=1 Tax=Slackia heliotrinireducens TaxID=84110 RepID=UPI0001A36A59|nr:molecular chaperone TorD family protein [Slackia heliotrinireducens]VEG99587.1 Uncharacterized component of anaerobic dehydrogenases [Slackia heliotrinireducens]